MTGLLSFDPPPPDRHLQETLSAATSEIRRRWHNDPWWLRKADVYEACREELASEIDPREHARNWAVARLEGAASDLDAAERAALAQLARALEEGLSGVSLRSRQRQLKRFAPDVLARGEDCGAGAGMRRSGRLVAVGGME